MARFQIPLNSTISTDCTPPNIEKLSNPMFEWNQQIYHKSALSNTYRYRLATPFVYDELFMTSEGIPIFYRDDGTVYAFNKKTNQIELISNVDPRGIESVEQLSSNTLDILYMSTFKYELIKDQNGNLTKVITDLSDGFVEQIGYPGNTIYNAIFIQETSGEFISFRDNGTGFVQTRINDVSVIGIDFNNDDAASACAVKFSTYIHLSNQKTGVVDYVLETINNKMFRINTTNNTFIVIHNAGPLFKGGDSFWYFTHTIPSNRSGLFNVENEWGFGSYILKTTGLSTLIDMPAGDLRFPPDGSIDDIVSKEVVCVADSIGRTTFIVCYLADDYKLYQYIDWSPNNPVEISRVDISFYTEKSENSLLFGIDDISDYDKNESDLKLSTNRRARLFSGFNIIINSNEHTSISFSDDNNNVGSLITAIGSLGDSPYVRIYNTKEDGVTKIILLYKDFRGDQNEIKISTQLTKEKIKKISDGLYKINTLSTNNLIVENGDYIEIQQGSLDWNNRFIIGECFNPDNNTSIKTFIENSGYNALFELTQKRSSSMIIANTQIPSYVSNIKDFIIFPLCYVIENNEKKTDEHIDFFYVITDDKGTIPLYQFSWYSSGNSIIESYKGIPYPQITDGTLQYPIPITALFGVSTTISNSADLGSGLYTYLFTYENMPYEIYYSGNVSFQPGVYFSIYGQMYMFDGLNIFLINISNNVIISLQQVVYIMGFRFLGSSPFEAFFVSDFDNSIYVYTGSRDLIKALEFSNQGKIIKSVYDPYSSSLMILTDGVVFIFRNNILSTFDDVTFNENKIIGFSVTKMGTFFINNKEAELMAPRDQEINNPILSKERLKFLLRTELLGESSDEIIGITRIDIKIYNENRTKAKLFITSSTSNSDTKSSDKQSLEIFPNQLDALNSIGLKIVPKYIKGSGIKIEIQTDDIISMIDFSITVDISSRVGVSAKGSA